MKIYGIRESWAYEIWDLVEFYLDEDRAKVRAAELNRKKDQNGYSPYDEYVVEEIEVR